MIKWIVFGVISVIWIAVCWFFASMVALTDSGPAGSIAQQQCAQRRMSPSATMGDYQAAHISAECLAVQRAAAREAAKPAQRKGLLIAFLPPLAAGLLMRFAGRRR